MKLAPRIVRLPERHVAVVAHEGPVASIDETRRPLYRHMIMNELVGGPSIVRYLDPPDGAHEVDALVVTHAGFEGDEVCTIEALPAGEYVVADYEGPSDGLPKARAELKEWLRRNRKAAGPILQVHIMDPIDDIVEEQLQAFLG